MSTNLAPSTLLFILVQFGFGVYLEHRCIDEPSLTFNEESTDDLALDSYCLPSPQSPKF